MKWSPQQEAALAGVSAWLKNGGSQVYRLFGYAGTGKTTLAKELASGIEGRVYFAAYTGKAASVLRDRGCPDAMTIHQLIYQPTNRSKRKLELLEAEAAGLRAAGHTDESPKLRAVLKEIRSENENLKRPGFALNPDSPVAKAKLVVVDECSMVDAQMGQDLLSFGTPVLVLGDPAQLPPLRGGGFFTKGEPDFLLEEIHRQAADSPIIELATRVRKGQSLQVGDYGDSRVMRGRPEPELVLQYEQVLVGKNATRRGANRRLRSLLGRGDLWHPVKGDRLVCLRNNHDRGLLNGTTWNTLDCSVVEGLEQIGLDIEDETGTTLSVVAHPHYFRGTEDTLSHWQMSEAECFDYGYALTCHKAQGSQWRSVCVLDESFIFRGSSKEWLYTAITRASERVLIVK